MRVLKQSTQIVVLFGPYVDKTDGFTEETGLAGAGTEISKAGAAFGAGPTLGTHDSDGWYPITLTTTHTNTLGDLTIKGHDNATHLPVWMHFTVIPANAFDGMVSGTGVGMRSDVQGWLGTAPATPTVNGVPEVDATHWVGGAIPAVTVTGVPEVDVTHWIGTAAATPTVAGVPEVDMTHLVGVAQSATDLKDFADDGYDPATNKVQGVVLVDTLTTYTGNTVQTGDSFARIGATGSGLTTLATAANLATVAGYLDTEIAAILADTNELQTDWANGGRLDLILDARASQASVDTVDGIVDAILVDTAEIGAAGVGLTAINLPDQAMNITGDITGNLSGSVGSVTGAVGSVTGNVSGVDVSTIKAKTDNLPSDPADHSVVIAATDAILSAVATVDTNVDSILDDTGTSGVVVAAASKSGYDLSSAGVTAIWAEVITGTTTAVEAMRGFIAAMIGKVSGLPLAPKFRNIADTKDVISATVDTDGNRITITLDLT